MSHFDDKFLEEKGDGDATRDTLLRPTKREVLASRRTSLERLDNDNDTLREVQHLSK